MIWSVDPLYIICGIFSVVCGGARVDLAVLVFCVKEVFTEVIIKKKVVRKYVKVQRA